MSANETMSPSPIHTPGPWVAMPHNDNPKRFQIRGPCDDDPKRPIDTYVCSDARMANARLIAAAPDLLDALRECAAALATARAFHKGSPPWVETDEAALVAAQAAIDKAIGG